MKVYLWLVLLFLYTNASGQGTGLTLTKLFKNKETLSLLSIPNKSFIPAFSIHNPPVKLIATFNSPYQYQNELGFFCKVELKWDKILYRPVRFRLGSYEYVNRLEGK